MKEENHEKFSQVLAWFDALPVILFSVAMLLIALRFRNIVFIIGAVCCVCAGLGKVIWKIIMATANKNITLLSRQLRVLMPAGFLLMIAGVITGVNIALWKSLIQSVLFVPAGIFFGFAVLGMILMGVFAAAWIRKKFVQTGLNKSPIPSLKGAFFSVFFSAFTADKSGEIGKQETETGYI